MVFVPPKDLEKEQTSAYNVQVNELNSNLRQVILNVFYLSLLSSLFFTYLFIDSEAL